MQSAANDYLNLGSIEKITNQLYEDEHILFTCQVSK